MNSRPNCVFGPRRVARAILPTLLLAGLLSGHALPAAAATQSPATSQYAVTVLPTLGAPFDAASAAGINDKGWIVGDANSPGSRGVENATEHATLWRDGHITDLGTLGGPNSSIGFVARPNDTGQITGNTQIDAVDPLGEGWGLNFGCDAFGDPCAGSQYEVRGFVWRGGVMRLLPTLGGNNALAFGGANDQGQIVGTAENADPNCAPQTLEWRPVIWGPKLGEIHELPLPPGDTVGGSTAINNRGQIVGGSGACGPLVYPTVSHALLWQSGGSPIELGSLGGPPVNGNIPTAINDLGQVVGWSDVLVDTPTPTPTTHAFLWQNGVMTDLGVLPDDTSSFAYSINNRGQVVGNSCSQTSCRAFLWQNDTMTDLNTVADVHWPGGPFTLGNAQGINDRGEIVGNGLDQNAVLRAWVAIPCSEMSRNERECASAVRSDTRSRVPRGVSQDVGRIWTSPALRRLGVERG